MSSNISSHLLPIETTLNVETPETSEESVSSWLSMDIQNVDNTKKALFKEGLYDPGSGELCTKYLKMSNSSILMHPYFNYPGLTDPGILSAIIDPEPIPAYNDDGQDLYLALCKEMNHVPVRLFYSHLLHEKIDLKYYGVNPRNIRAMAKALEKNKYVTFFDLTDNFFDNDACFHLGEMLSINNTIYELILDGCRIGPSGLFNLMHKISINRTMKVLNLRLNNLGDDSMALLANAIFCGLNVVKINLSNNGITGKGIANLAEAMETHNKFTHIDLSWNKLQTLGIGVFLNQLAESSVLQVLDLSWNFLNGEKTGLFISNILKCPTLQYLILSNNRFTGVAIDIIADTLILARKLVTLDLSYNPLTPQDAVSLLQKMLTKKVKVQNIFLENVTVNEKFISVLAQVKTLEFRKNFVITYGEVTTKFVPVGKDPRTLVLRRIDYVLSKSGKHKKKVDFALFALQLQKEKYNIISLRDLPHILKLRRVDLEGELVDELATQFPGPPDGKLKSLNIGLLVEYMARIWPDRKLPKEPLPPVDVVPKLESESSQSNKAESNEKNVSFEE